MSAKAAVGRALIHVCLVRKHKNRVIYSFSRKEIENRAKNPRKNSKQNCRRKIMESKSKAQHKDSQIAYVHKES